MKCRLCAVLQLLVSVILAVVALSWTESGSVSGLLLFLGRVVAILAALWAWFLTQGLLSRRGFPESDRPGDLVHDLTAKTNQWLHSHPKQADRLLIATSLGIDVVGLSLLAAALFGSTMLPFVALMVLFALRQLSQWLCALPAPSGMIWRYPGFPSLLVTYKTENDFFFSGHTAIAVLGAFYACSYGPLWLGLLASVLAAVEAGTVLVLRAHYTMDVICAVFAAAVSFQLALWFMGVLS